VIEVVFDGFLLHLDDVWVILGVQVDLVLKDMHCLLDLALIVAAHRNLHLYFALEMHQFVVHLLVKVVLFALVVY
jgi:hypothetical protein